MLDRIEEITLQRMRQIVQGCDMTLPWNNRCAGQVEVTEERRRIAQDEIDRLMEKSRR